MRFGVSYQQYGILFVQLRIVCMSSALNTYTKALFITLQDKLTLMNIFEENFSALAKIVKRGVNKALKRLHRSMEKFTKQSGIYKSPYNY